MQRFKKIVFTVLPILLGVFFVYYTFKDFTKEQFQQIRSYFLSANYVYVFLSLFFMKASQVSRAYRWNYQLSHLGFSSSFLMNFVSISVGYLVNLSTPKLGEVTRATILKKYKNIPFKSSFGTIIAERMIDLFFLFVFILIAFVTQYKQLAGFLSKYSANIRNLFILLMVLVVFFLSIIWLMKTNVGWVQKIKVKLAGFSDSLISVYKSPKKNMYLLHTCFIWGGFVLSFYFGTLALPETSSLPLGAIISAFVVGTLSSAFTNGGLGVFPLFISNVLVFYGVSKTAGIAFGWILWSSQTLLIVLLGLLSFMYLSIYHKTKTPTNGES